MTNDGVNSLQENHFDEFQIWYFNEDNDLYYPASFPDQIPEYLNPRDLRIKAIFETPSAISFKGYIVGIERIFSIGIFLHQKKFQFNSNLIDLSLNEMNQLIQEMSCNRLKNKRDVFPVKFKTCFEFKNYNNFSGEFKL